MAYAMREEGEYTVIAMSGEVDLSCAPEARKQLLQCLDRDLNVLVDLSGVTYIDSSGIATLVEAYQAARKKQLGFGLVGVSEPAMSVLELARLDKIFPIHASVPDRLAADG